MSQLTKAISNSGPGGFIQTLTGNTGPAQSPTAGNINILSANTNVVFAGTISTLTLDFGLTSNLLLGSNGSSLAGGTENVCYGQFSGNALTTGLGNCFIGYEVARHYTTGNESVSIGVDSMFNAVAGASRNTAVGTGSLGALSGAGQRNLCLGYEAGSAFTTTESENIDLLNIGVIGDNGVIRIGINGLQTSCFITGIDTVNVGSVAKVVTMASDKLGTATITAGTGITVTPGANTITIAASASSALTITTVNNAASPYTVLAADQFLAVDTSGGAVSILLPNAPTTGRVIYIKDSKGTAAASNITVTTVGGVVNIDGATTFVMNTAYESISVVFDSAAYEVF